MKKKISLSTTITLIVLAIALTVTLTMQLAMHQFNEQLQLVGERQAMYTHIDKVDKLVRQYYPQLDEKTLRQAIARGYIYGLEDTYAVYFTPEQYVSEQQRLEGKATNVGLSLCLNRAGEITVGRVHADSAAGKAGVQVGDVLTAVDGQSIEGKSLSELQSAVTSAEKLLISVRRGEETLAYNMSAYQYTVQTVQSQMLDNVGYVKVTAFFDNTPVQFTTAVDELKAQGAAGIVFDLRNNVGGRPEALQEILSYVMPLGTYGTTTDAAGNVTKLAATASNQLGVPTAVLVNSSTGGEAEFFAGVLQEFSLGTVVGQTTAGKAKFQQYFMLDTDSSALRLTVGEYGLLKGGSWQGKGITPSIQVTLPAEQAAVYQLLTPAEDAQVQAAIKQVVDTGSNILNSATTTATTSTATGTDTDTGTETETGSTTTGTGTETTTGTTKG